MKPPLTLLPKLADPAFAAAFDAADNEGQFVLPLDHFDDLGAFSVMLSVREAENAQPAGSHAIIALVGEDIRPLLAMLAHSFPLPRLKGIAVDYPALKAALPGPAFTTFIGMVQLASRALKCPAYALGLTNEETILGGFSSL